MSLNPLGLSSEILVLLERKSFRKKSTATFKKKKGRIK